jgi:hypothetical protein
MTEPSGFILSSFFAPTFGSITAFDQPVLFYHDAGQQPFALVSGPLLNNNLPATLTITGYLLDCSAAPCAAIAQ